MQQRHTRHTDPLLVGDRVSVRYGSTDRMEPGVVTELQGRYVVVLFDSGKVRRCNGLQVQFDPDESTIAQRRDAVKAKWSAEELEKRSTCPAVRFEFPWYVTSE